MQQRAARMWELSSLRGTRFNPLLLRKSLASRKGVGIGPSRMDWQVKLLKGLICFLTQAKFGNMVEVEDIFLVLKGSKKQMFQSVSKNTSKQEGESLRTWGVEERNTSAGFGYGVGPKKMRQRKNGQRHRKLQK